MKEIEQELEFPEQIRKLTAGLSYEIDDVGMSVATILNYETMVLKIEPQSPQVDETVALMNWLTGKLPVPKVLAYEKQNGKSYLLMSRISGSMSCDQYYLERPEELLSLLVRGLELLWQVDISDCPRERGLEQELDEARERVEKNLVNMEWAEPGTFGEHGFASPAELLHWLNEHKPAYYEPVFSHGDYCLPNIFLEDGKVSGFIDIGDAGIGDKWRDISLCYRSLKHNLEGRFGGRIHENFQPEQLFEALGIEPDWEKLRYYLLLDELF